MIPFKNLINDAYCRDISVKIRSHLDIKRRKGEFIGSFAVFGYQKDEGDNNRLVVDEYAAKVVRDIFAWKRAGMSQQGIADRLNREGVLCPAAYKESCGSRYRAKFRTRKEMQWSAVAVSRILSNECYTGTLVQGKSSTPNYKVKKAVVKDKADWEMKGLDVRLADLYRDAADGLLDNEDYILLRKEFLGQKEKLGLERERLLREREEGRRKAQGPAVEVLLREWLAAERLDRRMAECFVDVVRVFEGRRLEASLLGRGEILRKMEG